MKTLFLLLTAVALHGQTTINGGRTFLGPVDASGATSTRPAKLGTAAPSGTDCDAAGEEGALYVRTGNPATVLTQVYVCTKTGASSWAWNPISHRVGATDPTTCDEGQLFYNTTSDTLRICTGPDTWAAISGTGGLGDTGADGMVARTALNTTAARTLIGSDSTVLWTNPTGASGNPDATVNPALVLLRSTDQAGTTKRCASSSASTPFTCSMTPILTGYTTGMVIEFVWSTAAPSGAVNVNVDGLGDKALKLCDGSTNPASGDTAVGRQAAARYDGAVFRLPCNPATVTGADPNTVTAAGTLTSNAPVIGAGSKAAAVGSRSGNTTEFATINGTKTTGKQLRFDASGNIEASSSDIGGGASTETGPIPFEPFGVASNGDGAGVLSAKRVIYLPFVARSSAPLTTATVSSYDATNKYVAAGIYSVGSGSCSLMVQTDTINVSTAATLVTMTFASSVPLVPGRLYFLGITADATGFNWLSAAGVNGVKLAQLWNLGLSASDYIYFYDDTVSTGTTTLTMPSACSGTRNIASVFSQIWTFLK